MNFANSTKLNFNVNAISSVSGSTISMANNKTTNYDNIDYSDVANASWNASLAGDNPMAYEGAKAIQQFIETGGLENLGNAFASQVSVSTSKEWQLEKTAYVFGKTYGGVLALLPFTEKFLKTTGGKATSIGITSIVAGLAKLVTGIKSGKITDVRSGLAEVFSGGMGKDLIKGFSTKFLLEKVVYTKAWVEAGKQLHPGLSTKALEEILKKSGEMDEILAKEVAMKKSSSFENYFIKQFKDSIFDEGETILRLNNGDDILDSVFKASIKNAMANLALGSAIDYGASVVTSYVTRVIKTGDWTFDSFEQAANELKLGENLLISSYKTIFGVAFERMFTFAGPAGQKFGKALGTVVGAFIGEFWTKAFDGDEGWCAAAGIATIAGAVGGIWAGAAIASAVSATIPVAGWIVGAAIIVGAAVATAVVYVFYWLTGG